jgi:serine/threonine protein kinase
MQSAISYRALRLGLSHSTRNSASSFTTVTPSVDVSNKPATKKRTRTREELSRSSSTDTMDSSGCGEQIEQDSKTSLKLIGQGTFGQVYKAYCPDEQRYVAIKSVLQNPEFRFKELEIMTRLATYPHPYIVQLIRHICKPLYNYNLVYLHLIMEYVSGNLHTVIKHAFGTGDKTGLPPLDVLIYSFQFCRGLAHLHGLGIFHLDLKPQNILVDKKHRVLKICDFGCAKQLKDIEPHIEYVGTPHYRAPELIVGEEGNICYTSAMDVWSAGCVIAEMLIGQALFPGSSKPDQMIEITRVLGLPTAEEKRAFNPTNQNFPFPLVGGDTLQSVLQKANLNAAEFLKKMLTYDPEQRIRMINACADPFFAHLRDQIKELTENEIVPPDMFYFTYYEKMYASTQAKKVLDAMTESAKNKRSAKQDPPLMN